MADRGLAGVGVPPPENQDLVSAPAKERQDARRSVHTYKPCDDKNFPCDHCVRIKINRGGFALFPGEFTGADIRDFPIPGIEDSYDLWLEGDGLDTHVGDDTVIDIRGGEKFYTAPKIINAGSSRGERSDAGRGGVMGLTKHEAVLGMVSATNESVCLRQHEDGYGCLEYPMVVLARQVWEDMGEPHTVTVTVEPGDGLNGAVSAFLSSETTEPKVLTGEFFDQQMHKAAVREGLA